MAPNLKTKKPGTKGRSKTTSPSSASARREPARRDLRPGQGKGTSGRAAPKASKKTAGKAANKTATKAANKSAAKRPPRGAGKASLLPAPLEKAKAPVRSPAKTKQLAAARVAAETAIEAALAKKGLLPIVIDVSGQTTYTDFIGIISGRSDRQVEAIAENVVMALKEIDFRLVGREGSGNGRWTLLDFGDVVIHVFYHPVREFYDIESLWIDAPRLKLKVPAEAMSVGDEVLYYDQP
jgi:ribosome-associated protein